MTVTREDAKKFGEAHRVVGGDGWQMMADFANAKLALATAKLELALKCVEHYAQGSTTWFCCYPCVHDCETEPDKCVFTGYEMQRNEDEDVHGYDFAREIKRQIEEME